MSYLADPIYFNKPVFRFRVRPMATKKNLFDHFNEEDSFGPSDDAIKVFLRLKPTDNESDVIQVLDSKNLLFKMPAEFMQARNKLNMPNQYKYSFSRVYQTNTTQREIYTGCVAPLIKDFLNGQHCLLFTYGTTNAGKTFTVLGNGDHPGIIPRTLATVFKSITGKEYNNDQCMPDKFNSAIEVTEQTLLQERKFKEGIMTWNHNKSQADSKLYKTQSTIRSSEDEIFGVSVFREMQKRLTNDTSIVEYESELENRFSIWVSFAEIYNEAIYDLLQPVTDSSKRPQLKLGQDNHKNYYIKGLKHVFVQSEEEAYRVLMFGKANLQVAATGMNSRSSRSHCIFTIKLIKSPDVEHPDHVVVSSFSICDLAGAERQKKTLNVGLRLRESQNINCSLHVLSRCFNNIRKNQLSTEPKMIPFRESKLTQLFKHALTGKETVTMIVNVNSDHQLCEETQHVLKASAIAKHIIVQPHKTKRPKRDTRQSMFSQIIVKHNRSTPIPWDSCVKPKALEATAEDVEEPKNDREQKQEQNESIELKDLQEEVRMQQKQIDGPTDLGNIRRDEKKELRMELTLAQLNLSHRERDIAKLKNKIEMFADESALHKKYLYLEKEMEAKLSVRDELLNEAREDLLAEMRAKDDLEEENKRLEKELNEKVQLVEEMKEEMTDREDTIDLLEARIENMEHIHADEIKELKSKCEVLEEEITSLKKLEEKSLSSDSKFNHDNEVSSPTAKIEELLCEKLFLEEQLAKQSEAYSTYKQKQIDQKVVLEDIKMQLEKKTAYCEKLQKENETLYGKIQTPTSEGPDKENETAFCKDLNIPQDSPGTFYRTLRNRNK